MNKYSISYQKYDRGGGEICNETFIAPNDKAALLIAAPGMSWGCGRFDPDYFDEEEKERIKNMSVEDLCESICESNGDGQDYLFSLRNETSGVTLFEDGYSMEDDTDCNEWSEDMFEGFIDEWD